VRKRFVLRVLNTEFHCLYTFIFKQLLLKYFLLTVHLRVWPHGAHLRAYLQAIAGLASDC
jgi:hypothetical protein